MQHAQTEAKQVANMSPEQKQEVKLQHAHAEATWVSHETPQQTAEWQA